MLHFDFMQNPGERDKQDFPLRWQEALGLPFQRRILITWSLASRDFIQRAARGLRCEAPTCLFSSVNLGFDDPPVSVAPATQLRLTAERRSGAARALTEQPGA